MEEAANRVLRLTTELKNYSRKEPFQIRPLDLCGTIRSVELMIEHELKAKNIKADFNLPEKELWIQGDVSRIQQILLNLLNNAKDACCGTNSAFIDVQLISYPPFGRIRIKNNGPPMPLSVQNQLFQPYFTTKGRGKGTGLGLTITADLVEKHKGRLFFTSDDEGTYFWVDFPLLSMTSDYERKRASV